VTIWPRKHKRKTSSQAFTRSKQIPRIGRSLKFCGTVHLQAAAARVRSDIGEVEVLVNNAGVLNGAALLNLAPEDIQRTFNINILAYFWVVFLIMMWHQSTGRLFYMQLKSTDQPNFLLLLQDGSLICRLGYVLPSLFIQDLFIS